MPFRDAVAVVVDYLRDATGKDVGTRVPNPRTSEFVRVHRTGGAVSQRVIDNAQLTVTAWAADEGAAHDLAAAARDALLDGARRSTAGVHRVRVESFYYDPDPSTGSHRYTLLVFLTVRAVRS
ncbi:hypothetical protein SAMN04487781_3225 [Cellulosimicrobium cellulans]|nr:hypothetical protein SAMN04487781_3225 [Cellulosimicrobium cellulans]